MNYNADMMSEFCREIAEGWEPADQFPEKRKPFRKKRTGDYSPVYGLLKSFVASGDVAWSAKPRPLSKAITAVRYCLKKTDLPVDCRTRDGYLYLVNTQHEAGD